MDFQEVINQLNDLPSGFKRSGDTYSQFINSVAAALHRYTNSADGQIAQSTFTNATGKWLELWGALFGVTKNNNETDAQFKTRIENTVVATKATVLSIFNYIKIAEGITAEVDENLPTVGWYAKFSVNLTNDQYNAIANDLSAVRPAGVPFTFQILQGGLYLGTSNYLGAYKVTGSYLTSPFINFAYTLSAGTNNSVPNIPTTYLTDTTINPSL